MTHENDEDLPEQAVVVDTSPGAIVAATYETPQPKKTVWPYAISVIFLLLLFAVTGWFITNLSIRNQHLNTQLAEAIERNEEQDEIILELTKTGQALFDQINAIPGVEPDEPRPTTPVPGETGPAGELGATGSQGEPGTPGTIGPPGPGGPSGTDGTSGSDGAQGVAGPSGVQGEPGPQGPTGPQGEQGPQGIPGEQGVPGTSAYPFNFQFTYLLVTYQCEVAAPTGTVCTAL